MSIRTNGAISNLAGTGPVDLAKQKASKAYMYANQVSGTFGTSFGLSSTVDAASGQSIGNLVTAMATGTYTCCLGLFVEALGATAFCWPNTVSQFYLRNQISGAYADNNALMALITGDLA